MSDTRRANQSLSEGHERRRYQVALKILGCLLAAYLIALLPEYTGLSEGARWTLAILVLAAGLWITEAVPAFAVALLIIGLEIIILGEPGGVFAGVDEPDKWRIFIDPWASPLIWLFFGSFLLGAAAAKTGLDKTMAGYVLRWSGSSPGGVLMGIMAITFVLSMFMSNTATAAMMLAVVTPLTKVLDVGDRFRKGVLLAVAFAANLGGMGTIIGTPPNAIATGILVNVMPIDFLTWMLIGLPPALGLLFVTWFFLLKRYPSTREAINIKAFLDKGAAGDPARGWQKTLVLVVFIATVTLWMAGSLRHSSPTSVVATLPIVVLTATGVITIKELRNLPWDVLLLITGGLSLGVAVTETGLAEWLVGQISLAGLGIAGVALIFAYLTAGLSNFMSNTGASNILVPIGFATAGTLGSAGAGDAAYAIVLAIALGASAAMCLPIATPPNAIAYSSNQLTTRDFVVGGLLIGLVAPPLVVGWCVLVVGWLL